MKLHFHWGEFALCLRRRGSLDHAALRLIPGVEPHHSCSPRPTQRCLSVRTDLVLSDLSLREVGVDCRAAESLQSAPFKGLRCVVVWPPPITSVGARNKVFAVRTGQGE